MIKHGKKENQTVGFLFLLSKFKPHPGEQPQTNQANNKQRASIHINGPSFHKAVSTKRKNKKHFTSPNIEIGGRDGKGWTGTPGIEQCEAARKLYLSFVDRGVVLFQNFLELFSPALLRAYPSFLPSFSPSLHKLRSVHQQG